MRRSRLARVSLAVLPAVVLLGPARAEAQDPHPDLSGTWKMRQGADSLPGARRGPGRRGGGPAAEGGPRPRGGPGEAEGPRGPLGMSGFRTLTIVQSDSTVTIAGPGAPRRTYFTDGREIRREEPELLPMVDLGPRGERGAAEQGPVVVRAWWENGDLMIERRGERRTVLEMYRFEEKGPWLIVMTEIRENREDQKRGEGGALRLHRIYDRVPSEAPDPHGHHG